MTDLSAIVDKLTRYWRYGALPEVEATSANRFRTLADAVLDRAGLSRLALRTEPQKHQAQMTRILEELIADGAYSGLMQTYLNNGQAFATDSDLVKPIHKREQVLTTWRNKANPTLPSGTDILHWFNLEISFERGSAGTWETRARSKLGHGVGSFELPFRLDDLVSFSACLKKAIEQGHPLLQQNDLDRSLIMIGRTMWASLMQGSTRDLFNELSGLTKQTPQTGIRICLNFGPLDQSRVLLRQIPWEWLNMGADFLALKENISLVRSAAISLTEKPIMFHDRPSVLLVGFSNLETQAQAAVTQIKNALGYDADLLMDPKMKELNLALEKRAYDFFHYVGHGRRALQTGRGETQWMDTAKNGLIWVGAGELAPRLKRNGVRCALFYACESAVQDDQVLFHTAAEELLMAGIPSVIAMRGRLTLAATHSLTYHFYRELAKNQSLESALATARRAVKNDLEKPYDWHLPVLLINGPD